MINMFLNAGSTPPNSEYTLLFNGQVTIAVIFVLVAFVCVPVMLLVKPIHFKVTHKEHHEMAPAVAHTNANTQEVFRE
jgi:V-type H+-transporting ATPase subunit a